MNWLIEGAVGKKLSPKQVVVMSGLEGKLDDYIKSINELGRRDSIPKWFKPFLDSFRKFAADVSHHITEMDNKFKSTEGSLAIQKAVTDSLAVDRDRLQTCIGKLEDQLDDPEQYSRRNCLLIHGVEEKPNENLENVVMDILDNKLPAGVLEKEITRTHRIGRKSTDKGNKHRPIIIKFLSYRQRKKVYDSKVERAANSCYGKFDQKAVLTSKQMLRCFWQTQRVVIGWKNL